MVLLSQFQQQLWQYADSDPPGWWRKAAARIALTLVTVVRKFADGRLSLEATSLAYTTLLALVPFLAVSFSVLTAFGVYNQMEPMLMELLYPLGDKAPEITQQVMTFVENIRVGALGFVGIAMLVEGARTGAVFRGVDQLANRLDQVGPREGLAVRFLGHPVSNARRATCPSSSIIPYISSAAKRGPVVRRPAGCVQ